MFYILKRPAWHLPESAATPESVYQNRRQFLKSMGVGGMALAGTAAGTGCLAQDTVAEAKPGAPLPDFVRNSDFADAGRAITDELLTKTFNNFYEFGFSKDDPARYAKGFSLDPYTLKVDGLVGKEMEFGLEEIEALGYEERVYRFRCVEAWSMTVPWLGVPLRKLIEKVEVKSQAKYVMFKSFLDPERAPGQRDQSYPWPYFEGLRLDEAMNEMTMAVTGMYGKRLPPQNGTPLRIITPWKYGYKGPKSVVQMTFTDKQPRTFWNEAIPSEYKFFSNIDPKVPHPRWSQAFERYLGENRKDKPTQWYNGYGEQVAHMYEGIPRTLY